MKRDNAIKNFEIQLSSNWRLKADAHQWIVQKWGSPRWRSVSFIASNKHVLMRVLRERNVIPTDKARLALDMLPERFSDWLNQIKGDG